MKYLEIGQIVNTQGLKGEVRINPFTSDVTRFDKLKKIYVEVNKEKILLKIENIRYFKTLVIAKFKGLDKIEDIEKYKGKYIFIDETDKLDLPNNTYYINDLINCMVVDNSNNQNLGIVVDVFQTGSNDVYVIKSDDKEFLIPAIKDVINTIDINDKKIYINVIEGLL